MKLSPNYDRVIDVNDLRTVARALSYAEAEIHNPGAARAQNFDLLDLIDQAKEILKRVEIYN